MKIKVIYVMGEGRSGSTVLDILLSNHEDVVGAGEFWSFFEDDALFTGVCTCGAAYQECAFWREVRQRYLEGMNSVALVEINRLRKTHDRARRLPLKLTGYYGQDFTTYCQVMYGAYQTLLDVSGKKMIVDSTKQTGRAWNLRQCSDIDVYLLHLVRDGRGVIWSRLRDKKRDPTLTRRGVLASTFAWVFKNLFALIIGRLSPQKSIVVRYEDLTANPERELLRIGQLCNLDMEDVIQKLVSGNISRQGHQIGGNENARSGKSQLQLRPDLEWKEQLPRRYDFVFRLFAGWLAKYMGY